MFDDNDKQAKTSTHSVNNGDGEDDDRKFNREQQVEISFERAE
jgi:hypothetical protein